MSRYPFTIQWEGGPVPARLSTPEDAVAGLYLSLPAGELPVSLGCGEGLVRELWSLIQSQTAFVTMAATREANLLAQLGRERPCPEAADLVLLRSFRVGVPLVDPEIERLKRLRWVEAGAFAFRLTAEGRRVLGKLTRTAVAA